MCVLAKVNLQFCSTCGCIGLGNGRQHHCQCSFSAVDDLHLLFPRIISRQLLCRLNLFCCHEYFPSSQCSERVVFVWRQNCEFILLMVQLWPTQTLERHVAALQDAIKKGISDADADARGISRKWVTDYCMLLAPLLSICWLFAVCSLLSA